MGKHVTLYGIVEICVWMSEISSHIHLGGFFNAPPQRSRLQFWCPGTVGTSLPPSQRASFLLALGLWWQSLVAQVPEEISEFLHHTLPGWGTLSGMAAFKCLINIQIYSSHFNLNSMHIIK